MFLLLPFYAKGQEHSVELHWLNGSPPQISTGVSWGVPWPRGEVKSDQSFALYTADGKELPLQHWTLAYWPDGSIKWTGFATVAGPSMKGNLKLSIGKGNVPGYTAVKVRQSGTTYEINTGVMKVVIAKWGGALIRSISVGGHEVARDGRLVCISQDGPDGNPWNSPEKEKYISKVTKVTMEQSGPVRAVVKIEGVHKSYKTGREWLPFVVRLYFYAGQKTIRMVHTIMYDGNQYKDFIRGLAIKFKIPFREQVQNRHVMFSGEGNGLWAEPVQPLVGRGGRFAADPKTGKDVFPQQVAGLRVPNFDQFGKKGQFYMKDWAVWDDYKLMQPNAHGFRIMKRTNAQSAWIAADEGKRASGFVFAGDVSGGLGVSLKDFWQSYPSALEIDNANSGEADMYIWLWSPYAPKMDMRHYDTKPHGLEAVYEDVQKGLSTPYGVARTSELTLYPTAGVPGKQKAVDMAHQGETPPLLVASPQYIHSTKVFGIWSLPDRSTPFKKAVEDRLSSFLSYYKTSINQRNWYGFWNYGDVMHSYDPVRHVWRYDLGGMAWDNTELMSPMWLWYSFLRTGRADIYKMAAAMTRHNSEVDIYHMGKLAGLGSRHNVRHWGGGAKEVRISQATLDRFYYYLTTDERIGDVMQKVAIDAPKAIAKLDPMREAQPPSSKEKIYMKEHGIPARLRLGPDWLALVGDWMTEWERTGNVKWRNMITNGMNSIVRFPYGFRTDKHLVVGFNPQNGKLFALPDIEEISNYNLTTIQGGGEVAFEVNQLINDPKWQKAWLRYCRLTYAPAKIYLKDKRSGKEGRDGKYARPDRLAAYAYLKTGNTAFVKQAVKRLVGRYAGVGKLKIKQINGPDVLNPVEEAPYVSTNETSQWSLNAIEILQMCSGKLPYNVPEKNK